MTDIQQLDNILEDVRTWASKAKLKVDDNS